MLSSKHREQVAAWLREGKSTTEVYNLAREEGWSAGRATIQRIRDGLKPGEAEDPSRKVRRLMQEAPMPAAAEPLDLAALLARQLQKAEAVTMTPGLSGRDLALALKTVADLARLLRAEQERQRLTQANHVVTFYFPEKVELHRLEMGDE